MSSSEDLNPESVNWDYNAPTHVVDFANKEHEVDIDADKYFDTDHEAAFENFEGEMQEPFDDEEMGFNNDANELPVFNNEEGLDNEPDQEQIKSTCEKNADSNSNNRNKETENINTVTENEEVIKPPSPTCNEKQSEELSHNNENLNRPNNTEISPKPLPNLITPSRMATWKRPKPLPRTKVHEMKTRDRLRSLKNSKPAQVKRTPQPPLSKRRKTQHNLTDLTVSRTPEVLKRQRTRSQFTNQKSQIDRELEDIELAKLKAKQAKEEAAKSLKKALIGDRSTPKIHSIKTTCPKEFKFQTDARLKNHPMVTRNDKLPSEKKFENELRKHPPSPVKLKPTITKPFNLSSNRKRKIEPEVKKTEFVPMAKAVLDFQTNNNFKIRTNNMKPHHGLTVAKTPKLQARKRTRPVTAISMKELEEKEIEEIKEHKFVAQPLNPKILKKAPTLPKVERKETTKPIGFKFEIDKRLENRPEKPVIEEQVFKFKANPVPLSVKAAEGCGGGLPIVVPKKTCEIKAFSFAQRDEGKRIEKEEKIKEIIEKEKQAASSFRANPIFGLEPDTLPSKKTKQTTKPKPFRLQSDVRGQKRAEEWNTNIENEMKNIKESHEFTANTDYTKILYGKAFVPQKSAKAPVKFDEFSLHTENRKETWMEKEERKKRHEEELQGILREQQLNKEQQEMEDIKNLRKQQTHKANPIRQYKSVKIIPSTQALTQPATPKFSDRFSK